MKTCAECSMIFVPVDDRQARCSAPDCRRAAKKARNHAARQRRRAGHERAKTYRERATRRAEDQA